MLPVSILRPVYQYKLYQYRGRCTSTTSGINTGSYIDIGSCIDTGAAVPMIADINTLLYEYSQRCINIAPVYQYTPGCIET